MGKRKSRPSKSGVMLCIAKFFDTIAPDLVERLTSSENAANRANQRLAFIEGKLVGLLSKEQQEAAKICGISESDYALNLIELHKEKFFFEPIADYMSLTKLRSGGHYADWVDKMPTAEEKLKATFPYAETPGTQPRKF